MRKPILFGKYYLLERINVGGMAEVFKAKATGVEGFERLVAVKRILPNIAEDSEFIAMFIDEAKIAVQLTHANIAQIFDLGRAGESYFIALEYVHGKDLRAVFNRARNKSESIPLPLACFVIMKVCEALDYAHNKKDTSGKSLNFVHRDVSPQNILLSYEGEIKVVDFGIAKAAGKASKTRAGILKGKFGYMSPEQVKGLDIDRRSDVFGVGICLYELLTSERLFAGESDFSTVEKVRKVDIMPPSTYNRRIPEELEQIVLKSLAGEPDERYQTAMELHDELESFVFTSGNTYNRRELSAYMRSFFSEELAQESARDQKYQALLMSEDQQSNRFESIDNSPAIMAKKQQKAMNPKVASGNPPAKSSASQKRKPRQRASTLLGMPILKDNPNASERDPAEVPVAGEKPTVPPIIPNPQSIPPGYTTPMPPPNSMGIDWDDEELSTQIYDRPDSPELLVKPPSEDRFIPRAPGSRPPSIPPTPRRLPSAPPQPHAALQRSGAMASPMPAAPQSQPPNTLPQTVPQGSVFGRTQSISVPSQSISRPPRLDEPTGGVYYAADPNIRRKRYKWVPLVVLTVISIVLIGFALKIGRDALVPPKPDTGMIHLTTIPKDVSVQLDNRQIAGKTSPFFIANVVPNTIHFLKIEKEGYETWSTEFVIKPKQIKRLEVVTLRPFESGFTLDSEPTGATLLIDDTELAQKTPVRVTALAPGAHRIYVIYNDEYHPYEIPINVVAGTVLELPTVKLVKIDPILKTARVSAKRILEDMPEPEEEKKPLILNEDRDIREKDGPSQEPLEKTDKVSEEKTAEESEEQTVEESEEKTAEGGVLRINTRPWSEVYIDGEKIGNTPQMKIPLKPGKYQVMLVNPDFNLKETISIDISPGETITKILNLTTEE